MPRLFALIASLLCVVLLAACGGGDDEKDKPDPARYRAEITRISNEFATAGRGFRDSVSAQSSPQQAAAALEGFQTKVNSLTDEMDELGPPEKAERPHQDLSAAFREIAKACQPSIDAGKAGDRAKLRTALQALQAQLTGALGNRAKVAAGEIDKALAAK